MALSKSHFFAYDLAEHSQKSVDAADHLLGVDVVIHTEERYAATAEVR
jgi:hypothetical protein